MDMLRHYFISDSLDDLELFEEQLEASGISTPQIHVLSKKDEDVAHHQHLNYVQSFMKNDVIHSTAIGAMIGLILSSLILVVAYFSGWAESPVGWLPFIFLAVVLLGFSTWEGGLLGIQKPNFHFARFADALRNGRHVFFVDLESKQESVLSKILQSHPDVELAGTGSATPHWLLTLQDRVPRFFKHTFP